VSGEQVNSVTSLHFNEGTILQIQSVGQDLFLLWDLQDKMVSTTLHLPLALGL